MFRLLLFITTLFCESIAGSEKTHRRALLSERTNKFDDRSTIASTVTAVYKHAYTTKPERRETWGLAKTIFNKVEDKTKNTLNKVKDTTKDITDKVKDTTKDAIGDIKDNAEDLTDKVKDTANGALHCTGPTPYQVPPTPFAFFFCFTEKLAKIKKSCCIFKY
jgi:gas vesicle protein